MIDKIENALQILRKKKPVVLCLTNSVTQDFVANALLSLGASPIMSIYEDELDELIQISSSVYINIGTLDDAFINSAHKAIEIGHLYNKPITIDPVASGASKARTELARNFIKSAQIIRGNATEILSMLQNNQGSKGVESIHQISDAKESAIELALNTRATVIVSGASDFITDGVNSTYVDFGAQTMQLITGMGCALTAVCSAFSAVIPDSFEAGVLATHYFALCGETTSESCAQPGAFKAAFLDQLYNPDFNKMRKLYEV